MKFVIGVMILLLLQDPNRLVPVDVMKDLEKVRWAIISFILQPQV